MFLPRPYRRSLQMMRNVRLVRGAEAKQPQLLHPLDPTMLARRATPHVFKRLLSTVGPKISTTLCTTECLMRAKERQDLSFVEIAHHIGRSETWTAGLFYGKYHASSDELQKLSQLLNLPNQEPEPARDERTFSSKLKLFPVVKEILSFPVREGEIIVARGWIKTIRRQKKVSFVELMDGSTSQHLQVVFEPKDAEALETGCAIRVAGSLVKSLGDRQANELKANQVRLLGACPALEYPLQKKSSPGSAFLRKMPHLRLRTPAMAALLRIRSAMAHEACGFLDHHHFFRTETPIITFNDCEGAGQVFSVQPEEPIDPPSELQAGESTPLVDSSRVELHNNFFGREAFLAVSGQLHLEALAASLGRVYTIGPAFRAERSQTNRHLAEFWMLEAELSFVEGLGNLMDLVEALIKSIIKNLHRPGSCSALDLQLLDSPQEPQAGVQSNWPRITYDRAVDLVQSHNKTLSSGKTDDRLPTVQWGQPLASEHERWLAGTYAQGPIFVTDYPSSLKPFYMRKNEPSKDDSIHQRGNPTHPTSGSTVACFDLLVPGIGELVGGSLRESDLTKLVQSMSSKGLMDLPITHDPSNLSLSSLEQDRDIAADSQMDPKFDWYLDLRRFGSHSNAGFGMGWERLLCWVTGVHNVRDCIAFPRVSGSGYC